MLVAMEIRLIILVAGLIFQILKNYFSERAFNRSALSWITFSLAKRACASGVLTSERVTASIARFVFSNVLLHNVSVFVV